MASLTLDELLALAGRVEHEIARSVRDGQPVAEHLRLLESVEQRCDRLAGDGRPASVERRLAIAAGRSRPVGA